jgi:sugar/nucleoside kinase (ribokinase family)
MMSLLVIGSLAFDDIETPRGRVKRVLGGSATYFSCAASYYTPVKLVGAVGNDFPEAHLDFLKARGVDVSAVERMKDVPTFYWSGRYGDDLNEAHTLAIQLNTLERFQPRVPESFRDSKYVFLANDSPRNQLAVLDQLTKPELVLCDTRDFWIKDHRPAVLEVIRRSHGIVLNEGEAKMLANERNLVAAGRKIIELGARIVIIKKGEYGAFLITATDRFAIPAYPVEQVEDPTGAGDSFAGGLMGSLAGQGGATVEKLKAAMVCGTVTASFCVEAFSVEAFRTLDRKALDRRYQEFVRFISL